MKRSAAVSVCCLLTLGVVLAQQPKNHTETKPGARKVRTYYIAAEEVDWDYAPLGRDGMMEAAFDGYSKAFTEHKADRIGTKYRKAVFHEYTDESFQTPKPRPAGLEHMGLLGPVIRAEVGDIIKVVLYNRASFAFSMHPHGVAYERDSEGAMYADGMQHPEANGLVPPGKKHTYTWTVRPDAGPGPLDGSSIVWLYHSHNFEPKDVNAGLIGPIVITRRGMGRADASPKDIAREFFALYMIIDENQSPYFGQNVKANFEDPTKANRADFVPLDPEGNGDLPLGTGFATTNMKYTINGYLFSNNPPMVMRKGEHVRWYVMTLGMGFNFHTPHWHGNVVNVRGQYLDVLPSIGPAQAVTADMIPDMAGTWMFHCHLDDHMKGGMQTVYQVLDDAHTATSSTTQGHAMHSGLR